MSSGARDRGARIPIAVALTVAVLGWGLVWIAGPPFAEPPEDICDTSLREGASYEIGPALLPPGASKCTITMPDGARRKELYIPWVEWLAGALIAVGIGLGAAVLTRARRPALLAYGWLSLSISGLAAWFIGPLTALSLLGAAIGVAGIFEAVRIRQRPGAGSSPAR